MTESSKPRDALERAVAGRRALLQKIRAFIDAESGTAIVKALRELRIAAHPKTPIEKGDW